MNKKVLFLCLLIGLAWNSFADTINVTIELNGVVLNDGLVYVAVYSNENDYKKEIAFVNFILQPDNTVITQSLELPEGEYVVSAFQDKNGDKKPNSTIFGIPTERIGITNYNRIRVPGGFNKLKTPINNDSAKLVVNMGYVRPIL